MGIRIHKTMGWILKGKELDLSVLEKITLKDLKEEMAKEYKSLSEDDQPSTRGWLVNHLDLMYPEIKLSDPLSTLIIDVNATDEYTKNLYIFVPPHAIKTWSRYDDPVDYYEAKNGSTKINYLNREVFPYIAKQIVSSTLEELTRPEISACFAHTILPKSYSKEFKKVLKDKGIDIKKSLRKQMHQPAPEILQVVAEKLGIADARVLRPAIVTYWG